MEDEQNTHDHYKIPDDDPPSKQSQNAGKTSLPPIITRPRNEDEDRTFHVALARMHGCSVNDIQVTITPDGYWKIYMINGKQIFKDHA